MPFRLSRLTLMPPAILVGGIVIFSLVVAPTILGSFPRDIAGPVMRSLFPSYYSLLAATSLVGLAFAIWANSETIAALYLSILAGFAVQMFYILPAMEESRQIFELVGQHIQEGRQARQFWGYMHGVSMLINLAQLFVSCAILLAGKQIQQEN